VIDRPAEITLEYEDEKFKAHSKRFKGLDACVACHEHDHTLGICLVGDAWNKEEKDEVISEDVEQSS
jgi:peptide deformylase